MQTGLHNRMGLDEAKNINNIETRADYFPTLRHLYGSTHNNLRSILQTRCAESLQVGAGVSA